MIVQNKATETLEKSPGTSLRSILRYVSLSRSPRTDIKQKPAGRFGRKQDIQEGSCLEPNKKSSTKIERGKTESETRKDTWETEREREDRRAGAAVSEAVRCCQDDEWEARAGCEGSDGSRWALHHSPECLWKVIKGAPVTVHWHGPASSHQTSPGWIRRNKGEAAVQVLESTARGEGGDGARIDCLF